jgi:hypothetical protein
MGDPVFTPESWGSGAAQPDLSYVDFMDDVEKYLQKVEDKIQEGIDWVWEQWDKSILNKYGKWVSLAAYLAIEHAKNNLEDAIQAIWDKFEEVCEGVWEKIKQLFATPWGLMDLSERYSSAAGLLRGEATLIDRIKRHIQKGWSGDAFVAYSGMTDEQKNALNGLAGGLSTASSACATGAKQIWDIWIALLNYVLDQLNTVLGKIKDATDAGQWVTLEAGVVTSLVGQLLVNVGKLVTTLASFWADNQTVNIAVWNGLNDGKDLAGVVVTGSGDERELSWPQPSPADREDVKDKDAWTHEA